MAEFMSEIPEFVQQYITPKDFFGDEDASTEWEDPEKSASTFFHTKSYENFKKDNCLYIFGRRGTGKTAIIRMIDYEICRNELDNFSCSYVLNQEDAYHDLSMQLRGSPFAELPEDDLVHFLVKKWSWIIKTSAMVSVCKYFPSSINDDRNVKIMKSFLANQEIIDEDGFESPPWYRINKVISNHLIDIDYDAVKLGMAVTKISNDLLSVNFKKAEQALTKFLIKKPGYCLILIDSIEMYKLHDHISKCVITSLIEAVRQFYQKRNSTKILVKAAFPSEIYPFLTSMNHEKVEGKNLFILWRYKDIICLLAKRHYKRFSTNHEEYKTLDVYTNAQKYLAKYFPEKVSTGQGISFDTMAYIIRHTQKKPRQVILIFNIIHTLAEERGINLTSIPIEFIKKGVHARLDILVKGTLDIYEQIYSKCERIVRRVLHESKSNFSGKELDTMMKEISSLRAESNLSKEDVKRLLLECGAIGVENHTHRIKDVDIDFVEALFEYQVKGILTISNNTKLVLHPMLYQEFHAKVNMNYFVYPMPLEEEEQEVLEKYGMLLA